MSQWSVAFPGLQIHSADMLHTHGVTPSVCVVKCTPTASNVNRGDLTFRRDGVPLFSFRDCALSTPVTIPPRLQRGPRLEVNVLDRRWKWKYRTVNGRYNQRNADGSIVSRTYASYKDLFGVVLDAIGEASYSVELPPITSDPPTFEWSDARADLALAELAQSVGCLVLLGSDDRVYVRPIGTGTTYPPVAAQLTPVLDMTPGDLPYKAKVLGGPTVFQAAITLEAVGQDTDGEVRALNNLSYKLSGSWSPKYIPGTTGNAVHGSENTIKEGGYADYAQTVYRWYRVKELAGGLVLPDGSRLAAIDDILPLNETLADISRAGSLRPYVTGTWWDALSCASVSHGRYYEFDLDTETGIVRFVNPVYDVDSSTSLFKEPSLQLVAAFHARASYDSGLYRQSHEIVVNRNDTTAGTAIVEREDIFGIVGEGWDNQRDVSRALTEAAQAYVYNYQNAPQATVEWIGLHTFPAQGNIHQMRWVVNGAEAKTYGGKNTENPVFGPNWKQRRLTEIALEGLPC